MLLNPSSIPSPTSDSLSIGRWQLAAYGHIIRIGVIVGTSSAFRRLTAQYLPSLFADGDTIYKFGCARDFEISCSQFPMFDHPAPKFAATTTTTAEAPDLRERSTTVTE